jgi:hypothetical protein
MGTGIGKQYGDPGQADSNKGSGPTDDLHKHTRDYGTARPGSRQPPDRDPSRDSGDHSQG